MWDTGVSLQVDVNTKNMYALVHAQYSTFCVGIGSSPQSYLPLCLDVACTEELNNATEILHVGYDEFSFCTCVFLFLWRCL